MSKRREYFLLIALIRKPNDDESIGVFDGSGSLTVSYQLGTDNYAHNVVVEAEGEYATWTRQQLHDEANYLLNS
jgi:hypothetical protein